MSYVYLLQHSELPLFKIGLSKNPLSRVSQIGSEAFNLSSSYIVKTAEACAARRLERVLHLTFNAARQKDARLPSSGATEWFSTLAYDKVLTFIQRESTAFGVVGIETPLKEQKPTQTLQIVMKGEAWRARLKQIELNRIGATNRAYWLLWQFVNNAASLLAPVAIGASLSDGQLWLFTCAGPDPFTRTGMDEPGPNSGIFTSIRRARDVRQSDSRYCDQIPELLSFGTPREGCSVRLLVDRCRHDGKVGLLLADLKNANVGERLYVKALAIHIPAIMTVCGDCVSSIKSPVKTAPTDDVVEFAASVGVGLGYSSVNGITSTSERNTDGLSKY